MTPETILDSLKAGNARFVAGALEARDAKDQVARGADGQAPIAIVLACIDSRVAPEVVFDHGLGELFCVRVAGNVLNDDVLGSMEFACLVSTAKLIVVMGHSSCGAIRGACEGAQHEHLTGLLQKMQPAIDAVAATGQQPGAEFIQQVAEQNARDVVRQIRTSSRSLASALDQRKIGIVDAMYSVESGHAVFGDLLA